MEKFKAAKVIFITWSLC